jgi:hypothetical protein
MKNNKDYILDVLYFGFMLVSMSFTVMLFFTIGSNWIEKCAWIASAILIDMCKGESGSRGVAILLTPSSWQSNKGKRFIITIMGLFIFSTVVYFGLAYISLRATEGAQINGIQNLQKSNYEKSSGKTTRDELIKECDKKDIALQDDLKQARSTLDSLVEGNKASNNNNSDADKEINLRIESDKKLIESANSERKQALLNNPKLKDDGTMLSGIKKKIDDANKRIESDKKLLGKGNSTLADTTIAEKAVEDIRLDIEKNSNYKKDLLSGVAEITTEGTKTDVKAAQDIQFKTQKEKSDFYFFVALMLEIAVIYSGVLRQLRKNKLEKEPIFNKLNEEKENEKTNKVDQKKETENKEMIDLGKLFKKEAKKVDIEDKKDTPQKEYKIPYSSLREETLKPKLEIKQDENKEEKQEFKNNDLDELERKAIEFSENGKLLSHVRLAEKLNISRTQVIKLYYKMEQTGKAETRFIGDKPIGTWLI